MLLRDILLVLQMGIRMVGMIMLGASLWVGQVLSIVLAIILHLEGHGIQALGLLEIMVFIVDFLLDMALFIMDSLAFIRHILIIAVSILHFLPTIIIALIIVLITIILILIITITIVILQAIIGLMRLGKIIKILIMAQEMVGEARAIIIKILIIPQHQIILEEGLMLEKEEQVVAMEARVIMMVVEYIREEVLLLLPERMVVHG